MVQKSIFGAKIDIWSKNRKFVQKFKFGPKIEIWFKNRKFVKKLKFRQEIEILPKIVILNSEKGHPIEFHPKSSENKTRRNVPRNRARNEANNFWPKKS